MTAALLIFGVPSWVTVLVVTVMMTAMVLQGRYWNTRSSRGLDLAASRVWGDRGSTKRNRRAMAWFGRYSRSPRA